MVDIILDIEDVWDACELQIDDDIDLIASNTDKGIEIYGMKEGIGVTLQVLQGDDLIDEAFARDRRTCEELVGDFFKDYLLPKSYGEDNDEYTMEEALELIEDREFELASAMNDLLDIVAPNIQELAGTSFDDLVTEIIDLVCQYLYRAKGISVNRPMFLDETDGTKFFTEFPYPEIDFEE